MWKCGLLASAARAAALAAAGAARAGAVAHSAPQDATELSSNRLIGLAPCCGLLPGGAGGAFGVDDTVAFAGSDPFSLTRVELSGDAGGRSSPIEVALSSGSPAAFFLADRYAVRTGAQANALAARFPGSQFGDLPAVPESSTWLTLGVGFAALGLAGCRKARTPRALAFLTAADPFAEPAARKSGRFSLRRRASEGRQDRFGPPFLQGEGLGVCRKLTFHKPRPNPCF